MNLPQASVSSLGQISEAPPFGPVILYQAAKSTVEFENHSEHLTQPSSFTQEVTKAQVTVAGGPQGQEKSVRQG